MNVSRWTAGISNGFYPAVAAGERGASQPLNRPDEGGFSDKMRECAEEYREKRIACHAALEKAMLAQMDMERMNAQIYALMYQIPPHITSVLVQGSMAELVKDRKQPVRKPGKEVLRVQAVQSVGGTKAPTR